MFEIGSSLGRARKGRGLELADVEAATRIRARYLAALEEERFDELPDGYGRAFLRTYAAYLGLDAQQFVGAYDACFPAKQPVRVPRPPRRRRGSARPRAAAVLLAGAAALLALLVAGQFGSHRRTPTLPVASPPPARPAAASPVRAHPQRPQRVERRPRVVLRAANGDCWIAVRLRSANGPLLYENTLRRGQAVSFARMPLWVRVGAPSNIVLTLDRQRLAPLSGYRPLNIVVGRSGIQAA